MQALEVLDSINKVPNVYCEATDLLNMPPLSLDPVSEQVASNSQALDSLVVTVVRFEQQLTSLSTSFIPTSTNSIPNAQGCGSLDGTNNSYAKVASSTPPIPTSGNSYSSGAIVHQKSSPGHYLHHDGREFIWSA